MKKTQLQVNGFEISMIGTFILLLDSGDRRMQMVVNTIDAQLISNALKNSLSDTLFDNMLKKFKLKVVELNINKLEEGIFYSDFVCSQNGKTLRIECTTTNAIAYALKYNAPIYVVDNVLIKSSIELDNGQSVHYEKVENSIENSTISDLEENMKKAIANEDFEKASEIRDEINKRKIK